MAFTVDIRGNASHLEKTLKSVKGNLTDLGGTGVKAATAGLAAMGAAGAAALGAFVVTSSNAAASIEDLALQFEVLTGSAQTSKNLLKAFREEEKKSALNTEDYANAAKTFLAFGGSVEDTLPSLKMLADVSMGNSERFGSLALAFAQTTAAGRLMGQEVLQFVNAGFNPLEQIARDTGKSMADLKKEMEDGKISVQMVKQAFISATSEGGRFYRAIDKGSATTSAKINQTKAAVTQLQVAFGTGFNEGLKDALDAANNFLPQLEGKFTEAGKLVGLAMSEAVQGDTQRLAAIGGFIGEAVYEGFKAVFMVGVDNLLAATQNATAAYFKNPLAFSAQGPTGMMGQLKAVESVANDPAQAANFAGYMQTAIDNAMNSESARILGQGSRLQSQSPEIRALPRSFNGMLRYLEEISENTKMRSTTAARFSN
jgi:tape measure domain-containing protein